MSWVVLERAEQISRLTGFGEAEELVHWHAVAEAIHAEVMEKGWSQHKNSFVQRYYSEALDAAGLLIPLMGFLPANDPRVAGTIAAIERELTIDGLVHRFDPGATLGGDQLPLDEFEGAFLPVTFWFAHALAKVGRMDQAEAILKRYEAMAGELGLFAEEIAMTGVFSPVKEMTAAEFKRVTEVTNLGFVNGTLAALKRMLPRDQGRIIQGGSALAYRGIPLQAAYCASKHAIQGFMDSLRCELIHDKSRVRVTMVQMPAMNTPQFDWIKSRLPKKAQPVPPIFQPDVAAEAILYASLHDRREIYVGIPSVKAIITFSAQDWSTSKAPIPLGF